MPRLSQHQIALITKHLANHKSLNFIKLLTGIGKTTIYYYMKKRNGKSIPEVTINTSNLELIGEIVGIFAGDGNYYYDSSKWETKIRFYFNEKETLLSDYYFERLFLFANKRPFDYNGKSVRIFEFKSKKIGTFLKEYLSWTGKKGYTIHLSKPALCKNKKFALGFLRGLLDSDGYVRKGRKEIYFGSVSIALADDFCRCLDTFHLPYVRYIQKRVKYADFHKVRLSGNSVDSFLIRIKPLKGYV